LRLNDSREVKSRKAFIENLDFFKILLIIF